MARNNSRPENHLGEEGATIKLSLPVPDKTLFKHKATPKILNFLSERPDMSVSIRELAEIVPVGKRSTRNAVDALVNNGLLEVEHVGNRKEVRIQRSRLEKPDDPILNIPQTKFQTPVRVAKKAILHELEDVKGILLFGSVAQGRADRKSDIDLWVLVSEDALRKRTYSNELAKELGSVRIPDSLGLSEKNNDEQDWDELLNEMENRSNRNSSGDRYTFEILVESPRSILNQLERVDAEELFGNGISIYSTDTLEKVIDVVVAKNE